MPANKLQLQNSLQKPYDRILFAKEVLNPVFGSTFSMHSNPLVPANPPNKTESATIDKVVIYGKIVLEDGTEINCYEILLHPRVRIEQSKVAIQQYVRKLLTAGQAALINFISPFKKDVWRFTLVAKDSELTEKGIKERATYAKRYTFLLGPSESCKTAAERLETLSIEKNIDFPALIKAFSVEKLSKAFFDEYKIHYEKFNHYLINSNFKKSVFSSDEKAIRDFVKKLLGRIVFLYFVQKKGWLGATSGEYNDGLKDFIMTLFLTSGTDDSFYPGWLSKLYFETLNSERPDDNFKMPDGKKLKIPYLNGGLFDKEPYDEKIIVFKALLFHNPDNTDDPKLRGFFDFLNAYNFTIYEDSPDDQTVAVDPEMLGHIFENLLEDNKDKGAFYTPKEIVHYMCQESLIEYLATGLQKEYTVYRQLGDNQIELFGSETVKGQLKLIEELGEKGLDRDEVAHMVKQKDITRLTSKQLLSIDKLLNNVKICDPAIGSGAFPMGLLQEIFSIKELIAYQTGKQWSPAETKLNIIQNSIYGVDIEKGAVDIARLRFWLSLVVDEEKPRPLPNLDYKIVVGDSLISKFNDEVVEINWQRRSSVGKADLYIKNIQRLLSEVAEKQKKYFEPHNESKKNIAQDIRNLKIELVINQLSFNKELYVNKTEEKGGFFPTIKDNIHNIERELKIERFEKLISKLKLLQKDPKIPFDHFDWKLDFPEVLNPYLIPDENNRGFDILIGNPPYYQLREIDPSLQEQYKESKYFEFAKGGRLNVFQFFVPLAIQNTKYEGIICLITQNSILGEETAKNNRQYLFTNTEIIRFDSFPERDNTKTRVFEPVKMSVAISLLRKKPTENNPFRIYVWKEKQMLNKTELLTTKNEIRDLFPNNLIIPLVSQATMDILKKIKTFQNGYFINCSAGEIDMTKYKNKFNRDKDGYRVYTGAQVLRYHTTDDPSQGEVLFLKEKLVPKTGKSINFLNERIVMQRITGVDSEIRLIMTIIPPNSLCANSVNFIANSDYNKLRYELAILNSSIINRYFKYTSTNTNITTTEINNIPIPVTSLSNIKTISIIVDYILFLRKHLSTTSNHSIIPTYFEQIIDGITYELYFSNLIKKHNREIINHLGKLPEFTDGMTDEQKMNICKKVFDRLNNKEHLVRINLFYMNSIPEIAIIEGKNENN